jgi:hypothetical protein
MEIDAVQVLEANSTEDLENQIMDLGKDNIIVDLQYSSRLDKIEVVQRYKTFDMSVTVWSALALLRKKK